jgi:hypothetical protein
MKISQAKKERICEQLLAALYSKNPKPLFTAHLAGEIARDEEFVKKLLLDLEKKRLVVKIKKSPKGEEYSRRIRWKLSPNAYKAYSSSQ